MKFSSILAGALILSGCAAQPQMTWVRTDGARGSQDPALTQQFEIDKIICQGEAQKSQLSGVNVMYGGNIGLMAMQRQMSVNSVGSGCMAQKGYIQVPVDQAEETRLAFEQTAKSRNSLNKNK